MNVVLFNTYRHGGAGIAAARLHNSLNASGVQAHLITAEEAGGRWPFYAERLYFLPHERDRSARFAFSPANFGHDLRRHPWVQAADVLHLHWINQGLLSLKNIHQLGALGKPIVWTLHDTWAFTGGCHAYLGCDRFQEQCGQCPYLRFPGPRDLSHRVWENKRRYFPKNIEFVTCSEWLAGMARRSSLLRDYPIRSIPNSIDLDMFKPVGRDEKLAIRQRLGIRPEAELLLFVAFNIKERYKGFHLLVEALHRLKAVDPGRPIELLVLGKSTPESLAGLPYPAHALGLVADPAQVAQAYAAADLFVTPSLADNLPNTVMEALATGTPVAAFNTGGIPEMVDHQVNGYIAAQGDSAALANGIAWLLQAPREMLSRAGREKVTRCYAPSVVAEAYRGIYEMVMLKRSSGT